MGIKKKDYLMDATASFLNSTPEKDNIRRIILDKCPVYGNVLTLAGPYIKDARMLVSQKYARVVSIERRDDIFEKQVKSTKDVGSFFKLYGEINEILPKFAPHFEPFDLVFLDFCGPYGEHNEEVISYVIQSGLIKQGGHLALTLTASREKGLDKTILCQKLLEGGAKEFVSDRLRCVEAAVCEFSRNAQTKFEYVESHEYRNNAQAINMMFFIFKKL